MSPSEPSPISQSQRAAYLVLGMHRSGTSAVTQILAIAGATLPENLMPGDENNAKGYFEPWRISVFNDDRLMAAGGAWNDPFAHPYVPTDDEATWQARAQVLFQQEFRHTRYPLLKDPRVSVLLPLWRGVLIAEDIVPRCVIPIRHPLAVARSLAKRDDMPLQTGVLLWTAYMVASEVGSRDVPRAFVDYGSLLTDWRQEVAAMERALGATLPKLTQAGARRIDEFLTPELQHNTGDGDLNALGEIGEVAQAVLSWLESAHSGDHPDRAPLDHATELLTRLRGTIGPFLSPVTRRLQLTKIELGTTEAKLSLENQNNMARQAEIDRLIAERDSAHRLLDELLNAH